MTPESEVKSQKVCFFITPLGSDLSETRKATDGLIDAVLTPVLEKQGFELVPPHRIDKPGSITKQVIRYLLSADLVIANLSELNPNVMYELAVRHAKRLPIILLAQKGTNLPFDIAAERVIFFENNMNGVVDLKARLAAAIPSAMNELLPENPIYDGQESLIIRQSIDNDGDDKINKYILDQLEGFSNQLKIISNQQNLIFNRKSDIYSILSNAEISERNQGFLLRIMAPDSQRLSNAVQVIRLAFPLSSLEGIHYFNNTDVSLAVNTGNHIVSNEMLQEILDPWGAKVLGVTRIDA